MATDVLVPPLSQTADRVILAAWYKREGEPVKRGEVLFAIETDKATLDIEAPASGVLRAVTARPGDQVVVLSAIAVIAAPAESVAGAPQAPVEQDGGAAGPTPQHGEARRAPSGERLFVSPRARRLAAAHGLALDAVVPSGPEGAIVERDVRAALARGPVSATVPAVQSRPGAEAVGRAVSSGAAPVTLTTEVDATALLRLRRDLAAGGIEVSTTDVVVYAVGRALREHPRLNAFFDGETITTWPAIHAGLVAAGTGQGPLVPVVRDVDRMGLAALARETRRLAERARLGHCSPEELSGATFTVMDLGAEGVDAFTPTIPVFQCAILGIGRVESRPAVAGGQIVPRDTMWLSLTFDHRLVDGAPAARFLQRVRQLIEAPHLLLA